MEKRVGPTPNGGDYALLFFCDEDRNEVPKDRATHAIISEYKDNGTCVQETWGTVGET